MNPYTAMHTRADMDRLRRRARYALAAICVVGAALFAGISIERGITKANYDCLHTEEMMK